MNKLYDLAVVVGSYQDRSGNVKKRYLNIGGIFEKNGNKFILLDKTFNPAGVVGDPEKGSILISLFEPKNNDTEF